MCVHCMHCMHAWTPCEPMRLPMQLLFNQPLFDCLVPCAQAEVFVLAYTEELLQEQENSLNSGIKQTAKKHGVAGFADVANDLEKVSEQKSVIDEVKGMTLSEISKTVEEVRAEGVGEGGQEAMAHACMHACVCD
jgi:hypothetical protein